MRADFLLKIHQPISAPSRLVSPVVSTPSETPVSLIVRRRTNRGSTVFKKPQDYNC